VSAPLLETRALTKRFGGVVALDHVDLALGAHELCCLIGPNGAGKSTFFKCLTGELAPSAGSIRFRGHEIAGEPSHRIARLGIGIKTQVPSLFDGLTALENAWLAARPKLGRAAARSAAQEMLERVGVGALGRRTVATLGHGERQLVELAMVLAADPALILLDEPTAGMTRAEVERIAALIRDIAKAHALIVVEHDMRFVAMIAERVMVLHEGAVLADGALADVLADARVQSVYLGRGGRG
jgi:branched-chain amino acid transport system ATP-binding protein